MQPQSSPVPASHPRRPVKRAPKRPDYRVWLLVGGAVMAGFTLFLGMLGLLALVLLMPERVPSGVQVAGVPLSGQSAREAAERLRPYVANPSAAFVDGDRSWLLPLADIGVSVDVEASIEAALAADANAALQPVYRVDLNQAQFGFLNLSDRVNIEATANRPGRAMDIPVMLDRLRVDAAGELADGLFELDMFTVEPVSIRPGGSYSGATTTHIVAPGEELGLIGKLYNVSVADIANLNGIANPDLLYVGQELIIPAVGVYEPTAADAPPAPTNTGKSIVVSTDAQRIFAYENGQLVRSRLVSTGLPATPTVKGDYKVYVKYVADDMSGPDYFLPQVPYTMYFFQGYGIHGTYWHNNFGRPMSHGCVNLPVGEAEWFFNWAEVGTPVRVI